MDVRFINPFLQSVKHVFATMLQTEVMVSKPVIKSVDEHTADVSAVIGLSGDAVGAVVLSFPMSTATKIATKFAGVELSVHHPDFCDALGELVNMVAGHAKSKFEGLSASISLPSVVIGHEHVVNHTRQAPRIALPCDSILGRFCVEIVIRIEKRANRSKWAPTAPAEVTQAR